jgi:hypothetical protein
MPPRRRNRRPKVPDIMTVPDAALLAAIRCGPFSLHASRCNLMRSGECDCVPMAIGVCMFSDEPHRAMA